MIWSYVILLDFLIPFLCGPDLQCREDDGSTPAQEVFSSPLILPGQFLDSPEIPPKIFLEQFSKTLSAAKHSANRQNTAAARRPPPQLPNDLARAPTVFVRRDGHVPPLQPLYDGPYTVIRPSLPHFTRRIGDKEDKVSTLRLKPCTDPTAPPALPRVRGRPPAAVRFRDLRRPAGYTSPHSNQQNRAGNRFPLARRQGYFTGLLFVRTCYVCLRHNPIREVVLVTVR